MRKDLVVGEELGQGLDDGEAKDGTEQLRTKSETSLETEVDVGGTDDGAKRAANDQGTDGELVFLFGGVGVNWERVASVYGGRREGVKGDVSGVNFLEAKPGTIRWKQMRRPTYAV